MKESSFWLTLEPFVYVSIEKGEFFLYNTLNGRILEYQNQPRVLDLVKKLKEERSLSVIRLDKAQIDRDEDISNFIDQVRESFMGDLIPVRDSGRRPIQMVPIMSVENNMRDGNQEDFGQGLADRLRQVTIYISEMCRQNCRICSSASRQVSWCRKEDPGNRLPLGYIERITRDIQGTRVRRVNILGGNIFQHEEFNAVVSLLMETRVPLSFHCHYLHIAEIEYLPGLGGDPAELNIGIHFPVDEDALTRALDRVQGISVPVNFNFIIEGEADLSSARELIARHGLEDFVFLPYFNGENISFFKEFVFIKRENILDSRPTMTEILVRGEFNQNHYGHLVILSNGDVHSNLFSPKAGNIKDAGLKEVLYRELRKGEGSPLFRDWFTTRDRVRPCGGCRYNLLCPTLSNYERALGRNNLCHIKEG